MNRDLRSYNKELVRSIADELGIPEEKVPVLISKIAELVKPQVSDFIGRRALLAAGLGGLLTAAMASPVAARMTITDQYIDLDGEKFYPSSVAPYSAIVYKDSNVVKAEDWKGKEIACGTAGEDDAAVIQAALDVGGTVKISKGTYLLNTTLTIKSNTILIGEGRGKSNLKISDGANVHAIQNPSTESIENIAIIGLTIDGNRANQTSNGGGISIGYGVSKKNIVIRDIEILNCLSHAIWLNGNPAPQNILVENIYVYNCYSGVASYYVEDITVRKAYIDTVDWEGIHLTGNSAESPTLVSKRVHIEDVYIKSASANAIDISYVEGAIVRNWVAENCGAKGVNGEPLADGAHSDLPYGDVSIIENGIALNCGGSAIYITYGYRTRVRNVFAINCGHGYTDGRRMGFLFAVEEGVIENCVAYKCNGSGFWLNINASRTRVVNCYAIENGEHGIGWNSPQYGVIENCVCLNNGQSGTGYNGIHLQGSLGSFRTIVKGNFCGDTQTTKTQEYGIYETSTASTFTGDNIIVENIVPSGLQKIAPIYKTGTNTLVKRNLGYTTENSGTATITSGTTSVTVSHGLASTPSKVIVTPITSLGSATKWWVANITSTTFDIVVDADPLQNVTFAWQAEV